MKRLLFVLLCILALGNFVKAAPDSTQVPVIVAGHVISALTGLGIPAHPVYIVGDSFSTINIYDSAFTNALGYYADTFLVPSGSMYIFSVYTYDCLGVEHDSAVGGVQNYFEVDFEICDSVPPSCNAAFTYAADPLNPAHIQFTDNSSGNVTQWYWDFGDGSFSVQQNTSHTYVSSGTYAVTLYIYDTTVVPQCYSIISQVITVNVYPMFNLGGQVFGGLFPLNEGYAVLYKPAGPEYLVLDTALLNTDGVYYFYQVPAGSYVVRAFAGESPAGGQRYFPTYSLSSLVWQSATTISLGQNFFDADVSLYAVPATNGGGAAVAGDVFLDLTTGPLALEGVEVILFDSLMQAMDYTLSAADGSYSFDQLNAGLYYLRLEIPGKTLAAVTFHVGNGFPLEAHVDLGVPGGVIGIEDIHEDIYASPVFPNPATTSCSIRLEARCSTGVLLRVMDISGRMLSAQSYPVTSGTNTFEVPVQGLAPGLYFVVIHGEDGMIIVRKMQIIHP